MEGLGWKPRLYDLVGLERAEERYPIESSGWKIEMQKKQTQLS